jgi:hypothetical protein
MLKYSIIIIFLLIICIIFLINKKNNNKEHYDARISDVDSYEKCANLCSSVYGCSGFAYNPSIYKCYLSKFPLTAPPIPSVFSNEYQSENVYCNKALPILSDASINNDLYVDNKIYDCYKNKAELIGKKYIDINARERPIQFNDVQGLKSDPYTIQNLNWPKTNYDIKFDNKLNILYDEQDIYYDIDRANEHVGTYLNPGMCKTDTSLDKCLQDCTNNPDCTGVEYNVNFKNYDNVCCPKSKIDKIIKRRHNTKYGSFYTKKINQK